MYELATTHKGADAGAAIAWQDRRVRGDAGQLGAPLVLRVAVAACFIGHGAFGIITKTAWLPYFAIFGIPEAWAWRLMPVVGTVDITVGVLTLFHPVRAVVLYMAFWGFQTACLRPLAGQGVWELLERAGNYGVPPGLPHPARLGSPRCPTGSRRGRASAPHRESGPGRSDGSFGSRPHCC